jgi:hypothetical protein
VYDLVDLENGNNLGPEVVPFDPVGSIITRTSKTLAPAIGARGGLIFRFGWPLLGEDARDESRDGDRWRWRYPVDIETMIQVDSADEFSSGLSLEIGEQMRVRLLWGWSIWN